MDGDVGVVDLKATGEASAECDGAHFSADASGGITVDGEGCGLSAYDYSVQYCGPVEV